MKAVGIKVLKNKLSEYVRLAEAGETVLVTDHHRVVAELGPPGASRAPDVGDAVLAALMRDGIVRPPVNRNARIPKGGIVPLSEVLDFLDETRADR